MRIEVYTFPVEDIVAIDKVSMELTQKKKEVGNLYPEEQDWLDWALNTLAEAEREVYCR